MCVLYLLYGFGCCMWSKRIFPSVAWGPASNHPNCVYPPSSLWTQCHRVPDPTIWLNLNVVPDSCRILWKWPQLSKYEQISRSRAFETYGKVADVDDHRFAGHQQEIPNLFQNRQKWWNEKAVINDPIISQISGRMLVLMISGKFITCILRTSLKIENSECKDKPNAEV